MKYLAHSLCMLERARARGRGRAREASRVTVVGGVIASVRARARARDRPGVINGLLCDQRRVRAREKNQVIVKGTSRVEEV